MSTDFFIFVQEGLNVGAQAASTAMSAAQPDTEKLKLVNQLAHGWYIYIPQLILSIVTIYIFIERSMAINRADKAEGNFMDKIKDYINQGKLDSAKNLCSTSQTPIARMIEKGISRIGKPLEDINKAIENTGKLEVHKMEKNITILATIASIAPMLGFLGTVFGVITIFHDIAEVGSLQISTVSQGLYLKMISSAAGLIVGMLAYIGYNTLITRVGKVVNKMEAHAVEFIDILEQPSN
jgi:biopolymer transport protein ExbB